MITYCFSKVNNACKDNKKPPSCGWFNDDTEHEFACKNECDKVMSKLTKIL